MATYRQIHTQIWGDPKIESLSPIAKLVFIYGFSNKHRNEACIYQVTVKKISFETGLDIKQVEEALNELETKHLVYYDWDYCVLWVKNALHYQSVSSKTKIAIEKDLSTINSPLKDQFIEYHQEILNPINTLLIPYQNGMDSQEIPSITNTLTNTNTNINKESTEIITEATQTERECLNALKGTPGYPYDYEKDLSMIRDYSIEFSTVDILVEVKKWTNNKKRDKPLTNNSNPRSQLRNWLMKAVEFNKGRSRAPTKPRDPRKAKRQEELKALYRS